MEEEILNYDDNLTKMIVNSKIFLESFKDENVKKRLDILKIMVDYEIRKSIKQRRKSENEKEHYLDQAVDIWQLKKELERRNYFNGHLNDWLDEYEYIRQDIRVLYNSLENQFKTNIRGLYTTLIAEIIYEKIKKDIDFIQIN